MGYRQEVYGLDACGQRQLASSADAGDSSGYLDAGIAITDARSFGTGNFAYWDVDGAIGRGWLTSDPQDC